MPQIITQDWANGPMGPGFLVMFRRNIPEFFDGGPMDALIGKKDGKVDKQKRRDELFAVMMLMREQV